MMKPASTRPAAAGRDVAGNAFFPAVEPSAGAFPLLQDLWPAVRTELERHHGMDVTVHTELRTVLSASGEVERKRFYWSTQHADPDAPFGFRARTVYCEAAPEAPALHTFPAEPALKWLDDREGPLYQDGHPERVDILRYIPLRRLTFRLYDGAGLPQRVIAKVKRPSGLTRAAIALLAVNAASRRRRSDAPVVPRLLRLDPPRHALYLEELPGEPLNRAIGDLDVTTAMEELGRLHRALQELEVRHVTARRITADWLADCSEAVIQIGLFVPSMRDRAQDICDQLARTAPKEGRLLFCQGDFLPGQVLCHGSGWSVVDFDDSRWADPLSEVAAMYAAMPRELGLPPQTADGARRTYLEAYSRRAGEPFDERRWRWFLVAVQLNELAKRLMKGRAVPGEAESVLDRLSGTIRDG